MNTVCSDEFVTITQQLIALTRHFSCRRKYLVSVHFRYYIYKNFDRGVKRIQRQCAKSFSHSILSSISRLRHYFCVIAEKLIRSGRIFIVGYHNSWFAALLFIINWWNVFCFAQQTRRQQILSTLFSSNFAFHNRLWSTGYYWISSGISFHWCIVFVALEHTQRIGCSLLRLTTTEGTFYCCSSCWLWFSFCVGYVSSSWYYRGHNCCKTRMIEWMDKSYASGYDAYKCSWGPLISERLKRRSVPDTW